VVIRSRDTLPFVAAIVGPAAASTVLLPARDHLDNTNVALILVVVVVSLGATGRRSAGYVAALSSGVWFDFFFTRPYQRFSIDDRSDLVTLVLLLMVGAAVTELAVWGRGQAAAAERRRVQLASIEAAAAVGAIGGSAGAVIKQVSDQLVATLGLRGCRFQFGVAGFGNPARLGRDGQITVGGRPWEAADLPAEREIELLVERGGRLHGRYLMTAAPGTHPPLSDRRLAVTLADQVGAALG
jgi:hypothetical protein